MHLIYKFNNTYLMMIFFFFIIQTIFFLINNRNFLLETHNCLVLDLYISVFHGKPYTNNLRQVERFFFLNLTKFFHWYKYVVIKFSCTCRRPISTDIAHPIFTGILFIEPWNLETIRVNIFILLNKLILNGYQINSVIRTVNIV